jgi:hypothetical protein
MRPAPLIRAGVAALWLVGTAFGLSRLWVYESSPGEGARERPAWPAAAAVARPPDRCTLLLFAHPRCPCTGASLAGLEAIVTAARGRAAVYVFFFAPEGAPAGWERTRLWDAAAVLPGVTPLRDEGGRQARLFGARTSGQVLVYDCEGRLAYSGGITPARGHAGDSAGRDAVVALLNGSRPEQTAAPVYGCPLNDPDLDDVEDQG